jgi:hypothetical protein
MSADPAIATAGSAGAAGSVIHIKI